MNSSALTKAPDAVFLSDLHLKSMNERNGETLLRFFVSLEALEKPPAIFLLGDIFDLWISGHSVFRKRYAPLLESLKRLKSRGARIVYFEGNHDMHLAGFWQRELGAEVFIAPKSFDVAGLRVRCEHGDEMNLEDAAYLKLRAFLRSPPLQLLAHTLPGILLDAVGRKWSGHSRRQSSLQEELKRERIRATIRRHAERIWDEAPFDLIVTGHMHVKDEYTFQKGSRSVTSINLGSWFDEPKVLILKDRHWEWIAP